MPYKVMPQNSTDNTSDVSVSWYYGRYIRIITSTEVINDMQVNALKSERHYNLRNYSKES
jgi:hypothetical protein